MKFNFKQKFFKIFKKKQWIFITIIFCLITLLLFIETGFIKYYLISKSFQKNQINTNKYVIKKTKIMLRGGKFKN